jgi:hypothetical protein
MGDPLGPLAEPPLACLDRVSTRAEDIDRLEAFGVLWLLLWFQRLCARLLLRLELFQRGRSIPGHRIHHHPQRKRSTALQGARSTQNVVRAKETHPFCLSSSLCLYFPSMKSFNFGSDERLRVLVKGSVASSPSGVAQGIRGGGFEAGVVREDGTRSDGGESRVNQELWVCLLTQGPFLREVCRSSSRAKLDKRL